MKEKLEQILEKAMRELNHAFAIDEVDKLDILRVGFLGKKGELTSVLKQMGGLSAEERPVVGKLANDVREQIETKLSEVSAELKAQKVRKAMEDEKIDVTLPGKKRAIGRLHPLTAVMNEIEEIFLGMGFEVASGPEVEYVYYNFDALNSPPDHPARDITDTFYITDDILLRCHTSTVQVRVMETQKPPIRIISPGRVYRSDAVDATHSPIFHQIEGLYIDKGVTMSDLAGTLDELMKRLYGGDCKIRLRPHHFPFTEPSAEVDVMCFKCAGQGCSMCKQEGYIELLGAGMVHPKVLKNCGIDPEVYSGFAFGMGLDRVVMRRYGITDLRLLYENDVRFLGQF
ncbi:MAG: phenylalanine--tRNA ligase subunit alpha [Oscillospiraceae bacterium]|nr:phenylalanine--tRNA ligase subunit alpha [Oscillospiraceae bacterium]